MLTDMPSEVVKVSQDTECAESRTNFISDSYFWSYCEISSNIDIPHLS